MPASVMLILVTSVVALLATPSLQNPIFLGNMPFGHPGNYTQGSAYQHNLQKVLSTLNSTAAIYSTTSAGTGSDTVYGRYYCRHDVTLDTCSACVDAAATQIVSVSGVNNSKEAIIWYDLCTLLYLRNSSRLDALDVEQFPKLTLVDDKMNVTDPEKFNPVLADTMNWLINVSAYGAGSDGYATAEAKVSAAMTLYSLAQCSPDTVGLFCERCLRRALHEYALCCKDTARMAYFYATCQFRYTVVAPFYNVSLSTPAPYRQASTHSPPQGQGNMSAGRSCRSIMLTAFHITLITIMLLKN